MNEEETFELKWKLTKCFLWRWMFWKKTEDTIGKQRFKWDRERIKIVKFGLIWIAATVIALVFLKLANELGSYWINASWATGVWFGIETILFLNILEEHKENKQKEGDKK